MREVIRILGEVHNAIALVLLLIAVFGPAARRMLRLANLRTGIAVSTGVLLVGTLVVVIVVFNPGEDLEVVPPTDPVSTAPLPTLTPPDSTAAEVAACIADAERRVVFSRTFRVRGEARCPGGGCLFRSGSCNREIAYASYESSGPYYLDGYYVDRPDIHHGGRGGIEVTTRDDEGRALAVRVRLVCDPPDYPGAAGGWSRADIAGNEYLRDAEERREEIRANCEAAAAVRGSQ